MLSVGTLSILRLPPPPNLPRRLLFRLPTPILKLECVTARSSSGYETLASTNHIDHAQVPSIPRQPQGTGAYRAPPGALEKACSKQRRSWAAFKAGSSLQHKGGRDTSALQDYDLSDSSRQVWP